MRADTLTYMCCSFVCSLPDFCLDIYASELHLLPFSPCVCAFVGGVKITVCTSRCALVSKFLSSYLVVPISSLPYVDIMRSKQNSS